MLYKIYHNEERWTKKEEPSKETSKKTAGRIRQDKKKMHYIKNKRRTSQGQEVAQCREAECDRAETILVEYSSYISRELCLIKGIHLKNNLPPTRKRAGGEFRTKVQTCNNKVILPLNINYIYSCSYSVFAAIKSNQC